MEPNNAQNPENLLSEMLDNYTAQPKFAAMTAQEKQEFKNNLLDNLNQRISAVITINLPSEHKEEFLAVLERDDMIETQDFIQRYIPNAEMLIRNEASQFINDLLSDQE